MAEYYHLDVYKSTYGLLLNIFVQTRNLNKEYKYSVGEDIKKRAFEILLNIYKINRSKQRLEYINQSLDHIEYIRLSVRVLKDLQVLNSKKFIFINTQIEDVKEQLEKWYTFESKK